MKRTIPMATGLSGLAGACVLGALFFIGSPASAEWPAPPPEVIATVTPAYFEGHVAYWYGRHWHYHDARGEWAHYETEPRELREHRDRFPPSHHSWGPRP